MKPIANKTSNKRVSFIADDDNVRYKLNTQYFNNTKTYNVKPTVNKDLEDDDDNILYKFPPPSKSKVDHKSKPKLKVNFWSNKQGTRSHLMKTNTNKNTNRRHTIIGNVSEVKPKAVVKVRKRVSFLPTPIFNENHVPMVTVPDDLAINLNEEEAYLEDLSSTTPNGEQNSNLNDKTKKKSTPSSAQTTSKSAKGKRNSEDDNRSLGNENDLEFFSKYVVQKLRKMETNQRIYSENLINTVLMLGQLDQLSVKSKIYGA